MSPLLHSVHPAVAKSCLSFRGAEVVSPEGEWQDSGTLWGLPWPFLEKCNQPHVTNSYSSFIFLLKGHLFQQLFPNLSHLQTGQVALRGSQNPYRAHGTTAFITVPPLKQELHESETLSCSLLFPENQAQCLKGMDALHASFARRKEGTKKGLLFQLYPQ